ncbi:MAG: CPBP family intramembrane metalloprotease [Bacteroidia bacterium]|nr:CPBP family intramembrane metalloprotease [Bacteroidia bacterium]
MNQQLKKYGLLIWIMCLCGFLNYHPQMLLGLNSPHWGWMFSLLSTILIICFMRIRDPEEWNQKLGINFKKNDIRRFVIITILISVLAFFIVDYVSMLDGYIFKPKLFYYKTYLGSNYPFHYVLANYLYYLPETFNEEMLIGALLLLGLERRFKKSDKNFIAIGVALIFSLMHQGLYKWSPVQSGELLTLTTIVTLFFVGILRNSLILKTRNIAVSWAIHLSFNMVFFSGLFINGKTGKFPNEPEVFNIVFGNLPMLILTGLLASISIIWLNIDKLKKEKTGIENM